MRVFDIVAGWRTGGNPHGLTPARAASPKIGLKRPSFVACYALVIELLVAGACLAAVQLSAPIGSDDLVRFAVLAVALAVHIVVVWRQHERRRDQSAGLVFDLTSVWTFAAVVVLPAGLALLLIAGMRVGTYPTRRRPMSRYLFSTAMMLGSAAAGSLVLRAFDAPAPAAELALAEQAVLVAALAAAAVAYWLVQAAAGAGFLTLNLAGERFRDQWGSRGENLIEAATLAVGALLGVAMTFGAFYPLLVLAIVCPINLLLAEGHADAAEQRENARTDVRTNLYNSRGLAEQAGRLLQRCAAAGRPAAVLVIDLDYFKSINDTWGHPAGDAVLATVGQLLRDAIRPGDIAARDGGEEFVLVLPDLSLESAVGVADRIRADLAAAEILARGRDGSPVVITGRTASIGVAVLPEHGSDLDELRQAADVALYEAKNAGRNRTRAAATTGSDRAPLPAPAANRQAQA